MLSNVKPIGGEGTTGAVNSFIREHPKACVAGGVVAGALLAKPAKVGVRYAFQAVGGAFNWVGSKFGKKETKTEDKSKSSKTA